MLHGIRRTWRLYKSLIAVPKKKGDRAEPAKFVTVRSSFPSLLKSSATTAVGLFPTGIVAGAPKEAPLVPTPESVAELIDDLTEIDSHPPWD